MKSPIGSDPHDQRAQAGFTLLELLIVILIMAVVVGFSVPRFSRTFSNLQLQVFAYNVAKLLTYASKRAVARGEVLRIHFDVEGRRYWLAQAQEASPEGKSERVASKFGRMSSVPKAISLDPSARAVTFYPDGRADRFEMLIFDNRQDGYRLVTDVWTGRVKLLETHGK
jgi:prepilin-type N-terminal cleavage/methylation domain-containing protein